MTSARTAFSLRYELQPRDFRDVLGGPPRRRRKRVIYLVVLAFSLYFSPLAAVGAFVLYVQATADSVPAIPGSPPPDVPGWFYLLGAAGVVVVFLGLWSAWMVWRLSPARLARRAWRSRPDTHGRHEHEIGADGVTSIAPDGSRKFTPWTAVAGIQETRRSFCLVTAGGDKAVALPKRALPSPALLPELRAFLNDSAAGLPRETRKPLSRTTRRSLRLRRIRRGAPPAEP
jgi:hypothetical protein